MKRIPSGVKPWLLCTSVALGLHMLLSYVLFPVDLITALHQRAQGSLAAVAFLVAARTFLYFIAPGWAIYLMARSLLEHRRDALQKERSSRA